MLPKQSLLSPLNYFLFSFNMIDFDDHVSTTKICYANETIFELFNYDKYDHFIILLEFSTVFHAFFVLFLLLCAVKLKKQKRRVNDASVSREEPVTETTHPEFQQNYPRLGRFLSLVNMKM